MKRINILWIIVGLIVPLFYGCDGGPVNEKNGENVPQKVTVSGVVQKGPFSSGSNVYMQELNEDLSQTGRSFTTEINNHQGEFEVPDVELESDYAAFRADGFYFNEIVGKQSDAQLTLQGIATIADSSETNTNVLSHLEKPRIEYLVSEGMSFEAARQQAQAEVLSVFQINEAVSASSQKMKINSNTANSDVLLAVSSILQGYRSEAELSELLSLLTSDLKEDGELDNSTIGSKLLNHAVYLNPATIRENVEKRYADLGIEANIPEFESILLQFVENTPFEITERLIDYPSDGRFGANFLNPDRTSYPLQQSTSQFRSLAADLAEGTSLKIKISTLEGTPSGMHSMWAYDVMSPINWEVKDYNYDEHTQEFVALESGKSSDMKIRFSRGRYLVEYFEMGEDTEVPTLTHEFSVGE